MSDKKQEYLEQIMNGKSFVKVFPKDIGKLVYFDTSEPKETPSDTKKGYLRNRILITVGMVLLALIIGILVANNWYFFNHHAWLLFLIIVLWLLILGVLLGSQSFGGTDYFIGEKGFAMIEFKDDRENILKHDEIRFNDFDYIVHSEIETITNGVSHGTDCVFTLVKKDAKKLRRVYSMKWNTHLFSDIKNDFVKRIESTLTIPHTLIALEELNKNGFVSFPVYSLDHEDYLYNISATSDGSIIVGGLELEKAQVKGIHFRNGVIEIDYNKDENFFNKSAKINLGGIGNRPVFLYILKQYHDF